MKLLLSLALAAFPVMASAQSRACPDTVYYMFQMTQPARWIADSAARVQPTPKAPNVIQFVVDTLGVPRMRTFKALRVTDTALVADARNAVVHWRYTPGVRDGCRAAQLVRTGIIYKDPAPPI